GWMDEGFTDYQTDWAEKLTPQERVGQVPIPPRLPEGYRVNAVTIPRADSINYFQWWLEIHDRTQPIGTNAADFHDFAIYNFMIYDRAKLMYSQLRDVLGDTLFSRFMHDYYNRWALKHVDERAMRASAQRVSGRDLGGFFDQWVHGTGLMDYGVPSYNITTNASQWTTTVRVVRHGNLRHPMPVGVETKSGWTLG